MAEKLRQGQTRWLVWATTQMHPTPMRTTHQLQRLEIVAVRGENVVFKMGPLGNTSTWALVDFKRCTCKTYRQGQRLLKASVDMYEAMS